MFTPSVSATCRAGVMTIKVETGNRFLGVVHARDYRFAAFTVTVYCSCLQCFQWICEMCTATAVHKYDVYRALPHIQTSS